MYDIYYAHHQWKYSTQEEQYELDLIRRYFPLARIFNPATDLKASCRPYESQEAREAEIMDECLQTVGNSDILVFSSLDGCVGTGVYHEVKEAQKAGKIVFYIWQDKLRPDFTLTMREDDKRTDRLYAYADIDIWN